MKSFATSNCNLQTNLRGLLLNFAAKIFILYSLNYLWNYYTFLKIWISTTPKQFAACSRGFKLVCKLLLLVVKLFISNKMQLFSSFGFIRFRRKQCSYFISKSCCVKNEVHLPIQFKYIFDLLREEKICNGPCWNILALHIRNL